MTTPLPSSASPLASELDEPGALGFRRFFLPAVFVLGLFIALFLRRPDKGKLIKEWVLQGRIFGTTYTVKLVDKASKDNLVTDLKAKIDKALSAVDWQMSTYKKKSELSRFNQSQSTGPFKVSKDLIKVLQESQRLNKLTGGAFDITVGPIVNAWGFGPNKKLKPPSTDVLKAAQARVGSQKLKVLVNNASIQKSQANIYVDLSAIAKGYAVDAVGQLLEGLGFSRYLVEIGGELRARGTNRRKQAWRVGIEKPDGGKQDVQFVVPLRDASMATSGNYRNYIMVSGKRVSHIVDPRTSQPVAHNLASVTVVHPNCMTADALATSLFVLGPEKGLALAEKMKWAVMFLVPKGKTWVKKESKAFQAATQSSKSTQKGPTSP